MEIDLLNIAVSTVILMAITVGFALVRRGETASGVFLASMTGGSAARHVTFVLESGDTGTAVWLGIMYVLAFGLAIIDSFIRARQ